MGTIFNPQSVRDVLQAELTSLAESIKENHRRAGQVASGRTLRSIRAEVLGADENIATGVIWGRSPFGTLETGRRGRDGKCLDPTFDTGKPAAVPGNFTEIILRWMRTRGISGERVGNQSQESADRSAAYCIARSIEANGTKLYQQGGRADIYSNVIPSALERISAQIGATLSAEIDHIHLNA